MAIVAFGGGRTGAAATGARFASGDARGRSIVTESQSTPIASPSPDPQTNAIDTLISSQPGIFGIVLMKPGQAFSYHRNEDAPFVSASLYKLILMADIYQKIDDGTVTFDQTVELLPEYFPAPNDYQDGYYVVDQANSTPTIDELLFATGAYSSNVAADALLTLTDTGSLDKTTIDLGLEDTYLIVELSKLPSWPPPIHTDGSSPDIPAAVAFINKFATDGVINLTTPRDMAHFFDLLLAGKVVSDDASRRILDILKQQMVDDRFPYLLPEGTEMAHKTGNLDHVVHDVGIIWTPSGPVILVAMIEDDQNDDRSTQIIQRLAMIAYGDLHVPPFTAHAVEVASPESVATPVDETVVDAGVTGDDQSVTDDTGDTSGLSDGSEPPPDE